MRLYHAGTYNEQQLRLHILCGAVLTEEWDRYNNFLYFVEHGVYPRNHTGKVPFEKWWVYGTAVCVECWRRAHFQYLVDTEL